MTILQPKFLNEATLFSPTADAWAVARGLMTSGGVLLTMVGSHNLSELSNPATARTNLGLTIGTNVQAYSPNLTRFASTVVSDFSLSLLSHSIPSDWIADLLTQPLAVSKGGTGATTLEELKAAVSMTSLVRSPISIATDLVLPTPVANAVLAWNSTGTSLVNSSFNFLPVAGGVMTGLLDLPVNGLRVGTNQLTVVGGNVGINNVNPTEKLHVTGNILATGTVSAFNISGSNTGDQTITLTGDVTGSGRGTFAATLAASGVTAGTYTSVTVDSKGRVTNASIPTTLAGYGITDAQPRNSDLLAIAAVSGTAGLLRKTGVNTWILDTSSNFLTANQTITFSGDVTGSGSTAVSLTIPNSAITNTKLAQIPALTIKGNNTALSANPSDLTVNQVKAMLNYTTSDIVGLGSLAAQTASSVAITGGSLTGLSNLGVRNGGTGAFDLMFGHNGTLTTARAITWDVNDASRSISLSGNLTVSANATVSNTNTGDETSSTILTKLTGASGGGTVNFLRADGSWTTPLGGAGTGSVTTVSVTTANGISGSVATATSTPAITLTLGAITPTSVAATSTVTGSNLSGTNTGDQVITLTGDVTGTGTGSFAATIGSNAVTNTKLATMPAGTVKGNNTGGVANAIDLTAGQVKTLLAITSTDVSGLGTIATQAASNVSVTGGTLAGVTINTATIASPVVSTPTVSNGTWSAPAITGGTASGIAISGGSAVGLTGLGVRNAGTGAFDMTVAHNGTLTAGRSLTWNLNDTARSISLSGNLTVSTTATVSGTNTGDQTITLTGDITGTGTGSFATAIGANKVTLANMAQVATGTFLGRVTTATGNVEAMTGAQATTILGLFSQTLQGVVPASGGGTTNFLRADGSWAAPVGSGGGGTGVPVVQSVASSTTVTPDFSNDAVKITALAANLTLANWSGTPVSMQGIVIRIKDNGTARTIAFGTKYRALGVVLPTSTVPSKLLYISCIYNSDDDMFDVIGVSQEV